MLKAIIFDLGNTLISQEDGSAFPYALEILTRLKNKYKLALICNAQHPTHLEKILELLREVRLDGFLKRLRFQLKLGLVNQIHESLKLC